MFDNRAAPWLADLNEAQRRAATSDVPSLLVIAGAGTGKTKTLAARVAHLVGTGAAPGRILLLTFTRRASREMLGRAEKLTGSTTKRVWGGTFHSVANRLLRMHASAVGLDAQFTVMDQSDAADLMSMIRSELGLGERKRRWPQPATLAAIYSTVVNSGTHLEAVLERRFPWCRDEVESIGDVFSAYTRRKREQGSLDYDDLLLYWRALTADPRGAEVVGGAFDHILVDEYQDTNEIQAAILRNMHTESNSVMVVGDDAQAIYSFRAATVDNILNFPKQHRESEIVVLEQNYRSTQPILNASNAVIAQARRRYTKDLWSQRAGEQAPVLLTCRDETDQSDAVCRNVLEHRERGVPLTHQAVLFRAGHHSAQLEIELGRRNIPYVKYGGLRFVEAAHIKDVLALLRILENAWDELSWFRVLQLLDGIGPAKAKKMMIDLGIRPRIDAGSPVARLNDAIDRSSGGTQREVEDLFLALNDCGSGLAPDAQIERLRAFYDPILERAYSVASSRARDLDQLQAIASGYSSRERLITDLTLDPPASTADLAGPPHLDEDYLILSTIHSAKGCEWDSVHIIHAADGCIPSDMSTGDDDEIDEELRLFYVAMTRARNDLHVYFPRRYYFRRAPLGDGHSYAQLTRFLPQGLLHLFEHQSTTPDEFDAGAPSTNEPVSIDVVLETLWR